ncbi:MAG TPA: 2'-5' RNA ligase family protein, partial [Balneolaceae bacterium]|nr:2'-5' RNA ligase family protein [Balneolaceae bacterium]
SKIYLNSDKKMTDNTTIRCFIAIVLDERTKRQLSRVQAAIRSTGIHAGWPPAQNFHLTFKFLGNISAQTLPLRKIW